jgi:hypothetical protein
MKAGMILLLLMVLVTSYLIGRAIRNALKARKEEAWQGAKQDARWEVYTKPGDDKVIVGVQQVARLGKRCEVLDTDPDPTEIDRSQFAPWEVGVEVEVAQREQESYAELLNAAARYRPR